MQSSNSAGSYYCVQSTNICERIKPCNENSECIYSKENNTFYCRCLNGAPNCDPNSNNLLSMSSSTMSGMVSLTTSSSSSSSTASNAQTAESTQIEPKILTDVVNKAQSDSKPQPEIPKLGFNYDNVIKNLFTYLITIF